MTAIELLRNLESYDGTLDDYQVIAEVFRELTSLRAGTRIQEKQPFGCLTTCRENLDTAMKALNKIAYGDGTLHAYSYTDVAKQALAKIKMS